MLSVESKRTVFERRCSQLPPRRQSAWKESTVVLSCSKIADKMTEADLRKETPSEATVRKETSKTVQEFTSKEIVRIRRVIIGIIPYVKNYKTESVANSATPVYSGTLRLTVSQVKKVEEKWWKRIDCLVVLVEPL